MAKKLIIGNWKLNPLTIDAAKTLAAAIDQSPMQEAVLCPPMAFLAAIHYPKLGAQDCFWKVKGAYTGQTSPAQLKSMLVRYCIIGHSERRELGESNEIIQAKVAALLEGGIVPVLCIGHGTTRQEDELAVVDVLKDQLNSGLAGIDPSKVVVAYEPVWAIGQGRPATPEHAEKIALYVKTKYNVARVLYGGSTNSTNAAAFLQQPHLDGLLVGGASLLPDDFNKIINLTF